MQDTKDDATSLLKLINYCAGNPANAGFNPLASYSITAKHSYLVMEVASSSMADFAGVQQNVWTGGNHQQWLLANTNGEFKITNKNSGKVLDGVDATANGLGRQFVQNLWHGGGNQRYRLVANELGYYKLVNVASNRLADVSGEVTSPGAVILQWKDNNANNQQWIIAKQ